MEKYIRMLTTGGADLAQKVPANTVETAAWTVLRCRYGCDFYGKKPCCPPRAPSWRQTREMIDCFSYGILFRCREMSDVTALAVKVARELFLDGYYKAMGFGSGPCLKCNECEPEHCRFPKQMAPAMEACGIDVFATVRNNGLEIDTVREKWEPVRYFGLVLVE